MPALAAAAVAGALVALAAAAAVARTLGAGRHMSSESSFCRCTPASACTAATIFLPLYGQWAGGLYTTCAQGRAEGRRERASE